MSERQIAERDASYGPYVPAHWTAITDRRWLLAEVTRLTDEKQRLGNALMKLKQAVDDGRVGTAIGPAMAVAETALDVWYEQ